jgi:hypothetical protein
MNYATPATGKSHYQRGLKWGVLIISRNNFYLEGPVGTVAEPLSGHNHWIGHAINVNFITDAWKKCSDVFLNVVRVASRSNAVRSKNAQPNLHSCSSDGNQAITTAVCGLPAINARRPSKSYHSG